MNKIILTLVFVFYIFTATAQKNNTHAGKNGIWVLCGLQLPKTFTYKILRQKGNENFVELANLNFAKNKEQIQSKMLSAQRKAGLDVNSLSTQKLDVIWQRLTDNITINLPNELIDDYPIRSAIGNAWFDSTADSTVSYTYKVQQIGVKKEVLNEMVSYQTAYPGKKPEPDLMPLSIKSVNNNIVGEFTIIKKDRMNTFRIFRSYYLRSGFEEIQGEPIFFTRDSLKIIQFTDKTAIEKVPYSYVILPIDAAGNTGKFSPELKAFNVADKSIIPSVNNFKTTSVEKEKAIKLSWKLKNNKDIISIDIFKGDKYDGNYIKIASIAATDTTYLDRYASPVETYYYSIRLNGVYEKSPMSARVAGILKASNQNLFPPQGLRLVQTKNLVHLTWQRTENDTRAYYVYRAAPNTNKMLQLGPLIITDSATISYTDTIPKTAQEGAYAYAIADQNTSYAISGITEPVFAHIQGINALPIPYNLIVKQANPNILQIIWPNMLTQSAYINGYALFRRAKSINGTQTEDIKPIAKQLSNTTNIFEDNTVKDGMVYYYSLKTIADNGAQSSPSLETGFTIEESVVNGVANVRIFASGNTVAIKWDNPVGDVAKAIKLLRFIDGKEQAEEIASMGIGEHSYIDTKVTKGSTYYYQLQVENKIGKKSKLTDAVGVKIY